jgi:integrase
VGSNPTPGAFSSTPCVDSRYIQQIEPTTLSEIINFGLWMRKQGYRQSTIKYCIQALKSIARKANLLRPESAKSYLASAPISESRKAKLTEDLARFYAYKHIPFDKPNYKRIEKLPFVPLEVEVDQLISSCGRKVATILQLIKETGMRAGEAWNLKWTDLDSEQRTVNIVPVKNSNARQPRISARLVSMLNALPKRHKLIFRNPDVDPLVSMEAFRRVFAAQRSRTALKLQNPRIERITLKTLRHFKATMEYHETKDILHVMQLLGHKSIRNTLVYTHLVDFESDEWVCKIASTKAERSSLIEGGFTLVGKEGEDWYFRKRK